MEKVVYYCPNCGKTVSRLKGNKDNCSNCNGKMVQTPIDVEKWKELSDDEKAKIKSEISSYGIPEYSGEPLSVLKHRYELIQKNLILYLKLQILMLFDSLIDFDLLKNLLHYDILFAFEKSFFLILHHLFDKIQAQ